MNSHTRRAAGQLARPALLASAVLLALAALTAIPAPRASAHAEYDHSTPGAGEVVASSPARVDVYFKEEMSRANGLPTLVVVNESGDQVSSNAALDDDDRTHLAADLNPGLPDGTYTVIWHNVSADDGDDAQGAFVFYVGSAPAATTPAAFSPGATRTAAPVTTAAPAKSGGDSGDIPTWGLIIGIIGGLVAGGGGGLLLGRRGQG